MVGDILQPTHLLFILVVALLVLGPKRLPEVGRSLGNGLRDFKAAINGESHDDHHTPSGYVETESDTARPRPSRQALIWTPRSHAEPDAAEIEPATPTALHEHHLDPEAVGDDLEAPAAVEDLHAPAASDDLQATDDLHAPAASDLHTATTCTHLAQLTRTSSPTASLHRSPLDPATASPRRWPRHASGPPTAASRQPTTSSAAHAAVVALLRLTDVPGTSAPEPRSFAGRAPDRERGSRNRRCGRRSTVPPARRPCSRSTPSR